MSWHKIIESRIQDAMSTGAFTNLRGEGQPLPDRSGEAALAGENWLGFHVLGNSGHLPGWLELGKEIERDLDALKRLEERHARHVANAARSGNWERWRESVLDAREDYERAARTVRAKQDKFNIDAP